MPLHLICKKKTIKDVLLLILLKKLSFKIILNLAYDLYITFMAKYKKYAIGLNILVFLYIKIYQPPLKS